MTSTNLQNHAQINRHKTWHHVSGARGLGLTPTLTSGSFLIRQIYYRYILGGGVFVSYVYATRKRGKIKKRKATTSIVAS